MGYILTFLEGIKTFISPCLLPMIPIYIMYFAGGEEGNNTRKRVLTNALAFVLGFTAVFVALGAFAGVLGRLLIRYQTVINIVGGLIIILFGLSYLGVLKIPFLQRSNQSGNVKITGVLSSFVFGVVFSVSWTPCVSTFLGTALILASRQGSMVSGILMLLTYSLGLGIPFVLSAVLIDQLKGAFDFVKRHYTVINRIAGIFLIIMGLLMASGLLGRWLALLSF